MDEVFLSVMLINFVLSLALLTVLAPTPRANRYEPDRLELPTIHQEITQPISADFKAPPFSAQEIKKAVPIVLSPSNLAELFDRYSQEYSVAKNLLTRIADCESHFHTDSVNGDYGGMFQFASSTWQSTRSQMGSDPSPDLRFNGEEAIKTAAFKIARGGASSWPVCSKI